MTEDPRFVTAGNVTDGPLVVDSVGRIIEAHGYGPVEATRQPAKDLLAGGQLVKVERPEGVEDTELAQEFLRAAEATDARNAGESADEVAAKVTAAELDDQHTRNAAEDLTTPTTKPGRRRPAHS